MESGLRVQRAHDHRRGWHRQSSDSAMPFVSSHIRAIGINRDPLVVGRSPDCRLSTDRCDSSHSIRQRTNGGMETVRDAPGRRASRRGEVGEVTNSRRLGDYQMATVLSGGRVPRQRSGHHDTTIVRMRFRLANPRWNHTSGCDSTRDRLCLPSVPIHERWGECVERHSQTNTFLPERGQESEVSFAPGSFLASHPNCLIGTIDSLV